MIGNSDNMNPGGNPATSHTPSVNRFGPETPRSPKPYRGGEAHLVAMAAPATQKHCVFHARAPRAEFIVKAPAAITAFTIRYGRWVQGRSGNGTVAGTDLDGWIEDGTRAVTGATVGELFAVQFETQTDAVGIYITDLTGVAAGTDPIDGFLMWSRPLGPA